MEITRGVTTSTEDCMYVHTFIHTYLSGLYNPSCRLAMAVITPAAAAIQRGWRSLEEEHVNGSAEALAVPSRHISAVSRYQQFQHIAISVRHTSSVDRRL